MPIPGLLAPLAGSLLGGIFGGKKKSTLDTLAPGLIDLAGGLLGGILGGKAKKDEMKQQFEYEQKSADAKMARAERAGFKPKTPRFESWGDMGAFDQALKGMAMGMLGQWGSGSNQSFKNQPMDVSKLLEGLSSGLMGNTQQQQSQYGPRDTRSRLMGNTKAHYDKRRMGDGPEDMPDEYSYDPFSHKGY